MDKIIYFILLIDERKK